MPDRQNETRLTLRVHPGARRSEVTGCAGGVWQVRIAAPPVKGQANRELIGLLSRLLGVSQGALNITRGHTSRNKLVTISGLGPEEVGRRLCSACPVDRPLLKPPDDSIIG
ncbi:MAG: DUF167 domain-containing protein [Chloroflexota bacterium]